MYGQDRRLGIGFLGVDFSFAHLGTSQYCINIYIIKFESNNESLHSY